MGYLKSAFPCSSKHLLQLNAPEIHCEAGANSYNIAT